VDARRIVEHRQFVVSENGFDLIADFGTLTAEDTLRIVAADRRIPWINRHSPTNLGRKMSFTLILSGHPAVTAGGVAVAASGTGNETETGQFDERPPRNVGFLYAIRIVLCHCFASSEIPIKIYRLGVILPTTERTSISEAQFFPFFYFRLVADSY
jgi:hypothetical protein